MEGAAAIDPVMDFVGPDRLAARPTRTEVGVVEFDAFYAAHHRRAVGLAYALCGDRAAAEDIAHEAFVAAFRRWELLIDHPDRLAWLRRVIANRSASRWRRLGRESKAMLRLSTRREPTMAMVDDDGEAFWTLVRRLPPRQAQAVALFYAEDLSIEEIAALLKCSANTAKAHLFKARQRLAAALHVDEGEPT